MTNVTYLRSCALDLALEDVRNGWLKPRTIEQKVRFSLTRWLRGQKNYYKHSLTVDGVWITDYHSDSKVTMTEKKIIEVLSGAEFVWRTEGERAWEQLRTNCETWALEAFDYRNFQTFGMTVGSTVVTQDKSYFGGAQLVGEVAEVDPDDDHLPICVKFNGFPYLYFSVSELEVRSQPVKVPIILALPQERNN